MKITKLKNKLRKVKIKQTLGTQYEVELDGKPVENLKSISVEFSETGLPQVSMTFAAEVEIETAGAEVINKKVATPIQDVKDWTEALKQAKYSSSYEPNYIVSNPVDYNTYLYGTTLSNNTSQMQIEFPSKKNDPGPTSHFYLNEAGMVTQQVPVKDGLVQSIVKKMKTSSPSFFEACDDECEVCNSDV